MNETDTSWRALRCGSLCRLLKRFPPLAAALESLPARRRPALLFETLANLGSGGIVRLFPIALVVLETILHADLIYQMVLASIFYGSNLTSPAFTWLSGRIRVRWLVIVPNLLMSLALFALILQPESALLFTIILSLVLGLRVSSRIGEMNMFRLIYPDRYVSQAVGWISSVAAFSGLLLTLSSWWWLELWPEYYWGLFWLAGAGLFFGAWAYSRIPTHQKNFYAQVSRIAPHTAFLKGIRRFWSDRRFFRYELAFFIVGVANQMGLYLVPNLLNQTVGTSRMQISLIAVVIPSVTIILTSPLWGRYLASRTPMLARGLFSLMQTVTFALYTYGGLTQQIWPFYIGSFVHSCSVAGGSINWLTGSFYFATPDSSALYSGIHVFLTGIRGIVAPIIARLLFITGATGFGFQGLGLGPWIFLVCVMLSLLGAAIFFYAQYLESRVPVKQISS